MIVTHLQSLPTSTTKTVYANESLAVEFMGWKWMSYVGRPMKDHPEYPKECRVRSLMSPGMLNSLPWQEYLGTVEAREADGTEWLDYSYGSMGGCSWPRYDIDHEEFAKVEAVLKERGLLEQMGPQIRSMFGEHYYRPCLDDCCRAALILLRRHRDEQSETKAKS